MKRVMKCIFSFMLFCTLALTPFTFKSASATSANYDNYTEFKTAVSGIISQYINFDERIAGSESEKNASLYIKNYLKTKTSLTAYDNDYVTDGVQKFTYESDFSGKYESSQNIIFTYKSAKETDKKVILYTSYDAVAYKLNEEETGYDTVKSESVNGSAGSVATLLVLAEKLSGMNLNYNIDFCFFGAGSSSSAGAKVYTQGISEDARKNILCAINFTTISLGEKLYFYVDEIQNSFSKYIENVCDNNKLNLKQIDTKNLNKIILSEPNELGLTYSHVALESDNKQFMKQGITSISIFAGDYDSGIMIGRSEFTGKDVVAYTENDNLEYIEKNFGLNGVYENLFNVYSSMTTILTNSDFESQATNAYGANSAFYKIFGNQKLVIFLTAVAFVVFVIIAMYYYYRYTVKSYYCNIEMEFLSTVVKISEQVDKDGGDPEVSKVVSQVIAHDIKKDKTLKQSKKKNKEK